MARFTLPAARDRICLDATGALPNGFAIAFPDKPFTVSTESWARITAKHAGRAQKGLGDNKRKFVAFGVLCIEIFTTPGDGLTLNDTLADAAVLYLESAVSSPITYRNIRAVEIGQDGGFTKTNIYADFEYEDHH
jgi:hypothetical protein